MNNVQIGMIALLCAGCASTYQGPPAGQPSAAVTILGLSSAVPGAVVAVSASVFDGASCERTQFIGVTKMNENRELSFAADKPIVLGLSFSGLRPTTPLGKVPLFTCQDGLAFVPRTGMEYKVFLDDAQLRLQVCKATLLERSGPTQNWHLAGAKHVCSLTS